MTCDLYLFLELSRLVSHVFKVFDPERTGDIQFRKFMLVVLALSSDTPEENAEKIFYMVDRNSDGFISVEVMLLLTLEHVLNNMRYTILTTVIIIVTILTIVIEIYVSSLVYVPSTLHKTHACII